MDSFSRTMLAAAAESGLATITLSRHVPNLRRNVRGNDKVVLLAKCLGSDGLGSGNYILMLTHNRMVVTRESPRLGRVRPCIDQAIDALSGVRWSADPVRPGMEIAFQAVGEHFRFWINAGHEKQIWRIDALLARKFRRPGAIRGGLVGLV
ncbi:hypothetical protein [Natronoglycomyces albus]|uniref:Uncharacterized protein n=1 Tax=Natronoglycomyces albus TaxID=2811108 RepID=A0A895XK80_9ACTN|nr:hypothetical protein [Natronoglycomyces albus]QSB05447.1 hypothetical protein JQS30_00420 [Natronoglycomyces albus]